MKTAISLVLVAATVFTSRVACAQMEFVDALAKSEENRSRLLSYTAHYQQIVYGEEATTTKDAKYWKFLSLYEASVVTDITMDFCLSTFSKSTLELRDARQLADGLMLKQKHKFFVNQGSRLREVSREQAESFLNPAIIGLASCTDLRFFADFEDVIAQYRGIASRIRQQQTLEDGLVLYEAGTTKFVLDPQKAYLPVHITLDGGSRLEVKVNTSYVEHDGVWLPTSVHYKCGYTSRRFKIDWHSVNQPIPADVFDQMFVNQTTDLKPSPDALELER